MDRKRLFVYGTLCPGEPDHHLLAGVAGTWARGFVRGRLQREGWGAVLGYPALMKAGAGQRLIALVLSMRDV